MRVASVCLAIASVLALAAFQPGSDEFKQALDKYMSQRDELFKNGSAKAEDHDKLVEELFSKVDIPSLSVDQIAALQNYNLISQPDRMAASLSRLQSFHASFEAEGALALAISAYCTRGEGKMAERDDLARKFLNHPKAAEALRGSYGTFPIYTLAGIKASSEDSPKVLALMKDMESWNLESATNGSTLVRLLNNHASSDDQREANRVRVVAFMRKVVSEDKGAAKNADMVRFVKDQIAVLDGLAARGKLINHQAPDLKITWSSNPKIKSLKDLKGKVVVLDFWATWCGPCVGSFPNVKELQAHYKGYDVEIVGVTSLQGNIIGLGDQDVIDCQGDPAKEQKLMADYMKFKDISWSVIFTEQDVFNPDFGVQGIPHVAIIDPSGKVRFNGLHPADPLTEKTKKIDALLKEANLKVPSK